MDKQQRKEREDFVRIMSEEIDSVNGPYIARCIMRAAATHGRLAVESCNGHPAQGRTPPQGCDMKAYNAQLSRWQDRWDARIEREETRIERLIAKHCEPWGIKPKFGGDPRGYTVKLILKSDRYNTMGGREEGYGVPQ